MLVCLRISLVLTTLLLTTTHAHAVDRIMVVATFSVIGDMLANVGGDHIITKTIVGSDGDCELYNLPRPMLRRSHRLAPCSSMASTTSLSPGLSPYSSRQSSRARKLWSPAAFGR